MIGGVGHSRMSILLYFLHHSWMRHGRSVDLIATGPYGQGVRGLVLGRLSAWSQFLFGSVSIVFLGVCNEIVIWFPLQSQVRQQV